MAATLIRSLIAACLLLASLSAFAQSRTVKVRLFWQHPPQQIRIEPQDSTIKSCPTCPSQKLANALDITAAASKQQTITGRARVSGPGFSPFPINGELAIQSREGVLLLTLTMPLEDYVAAVLAGESASFKSDEALKAMAVAARTYAVHFESRHKLEGFDFCDTTHCQDVRLGNQSVRVRQAVAATQGELLWYEGRPAATYYHRSCGGELDSATALDPNLHAPYLRRHTDQYCSRTDEWHASVSLADLSRALNRPANNVAVADRDDSGRVTTLLISGHPISATDFRLAVGRALGWDKLRSDLYELQIQNGTANFRGRGQGHGVGLCQTGADNMGQQGKNYREILAYYYPGTAVGINAQGIRWETLPGTSLDIVTTNQSDAAVLLPASERALQFAMQKTGWALNSRPQLKVFPTIAVYRDATGEPGWVAASTRGNIIRLQPLSALQRKNALESTLRHEFLHMLLDSQASPTSPLWLREGLAIYLENSAAIAPRAANLQTLDPRLRSARTEADLRSAYRDCASAVADLVSRHSLPTVLSWLKNGLPARIE